jgi:hypothetical protein
MSSAFGDDKYVWRTAFFGRSFGTRVARCFEAAPDDCVSR